MILTSLGVSRTKLRHYKSYWQQKLHLEELLSAFALFMCEVSHDCIPSKKVDGRFTVASLRFCPTPEIGQIDLFHYGDRI